MLKVFIPPNNIPEKKYIIDILLSEFLGLEYSIEYHRSCEYLLTFEDRKIIFDDSFWGKNGSEDYLKIKNLPQKIEFIKNEFTQNNKLPILYGSSKMLIEKQTIVSGIDVFASAFFMLTRWEEYVNQIRDGFGRFPGKESIAFKNNFINRPIVNEYAEFIWNLLKFIGYDRGRKERKYKVIPTVDVDSLFYYNNFYTNAKNLIRLVVKGRVKKTHEFLKGYYNVKMNYHSDPYDTYMKFMDKSEQINTLAYFFFLSGSNKVYDNGISLKDNRIMNVFNTIKERGHFIGLHPGFDTYNNFELWQRAKQNLDNATKSENKFGRQHYLRFDVPRTWQIWEENKMEWDSTLGYADIVGFRCGTCYEYSIYDIIQRKKIILKEYPLLIMDVTLRDYQGLNVQEAVKVIRDIKKEVKKFSGNFVFLWHNKNFNLIEWKMFEEVFEELWL